MIANELTLNQKQISSFGRFLVEGADGALYAMENLFGLDIESSDSSIEITPALSPEYLQELGNGTLYTVSSEMVGDLKGNMLLLMRASDFQFLGDMMRPVLSVLFVAGETPEPNAMESLSPGWKKDGGPGDQVIVDDASFRAQMMDMLAEMGNVLIGLYTKAIYKIYALNTHHSVPLAIQDDDQHTIRQFLTAGQSQQLMHLVIENQFMIMGETIKLWCLISPSKESFGDILSRIESREEYFHGLVKHAH